MSHHDINMRRWIYPAGLLLCVGVVGTALSDLAESPWPTIHANPRLSQATDLDGPGTPVPDGPHVRSGVTVDEKWSRGVGLGPCIGNVSIGTDGSLYYANDGKLRKLDPDNGTNMETAYSFPGSPGTPNQPMITRESGSDRIYVGVQGKLYKFTDDLTLDTSWSTNPIDVVDTNPDDNGDPQILLVAGGMVFSNEADAIIYVAQGPYNDESDPGGTILFAVNPSSGAILDEFDVAAEIVAIDAEPTPTEPDPWSEKQDVASINTVSLGPDPDSAGDELVYVLTNDHILAVELDTSARAFASTWKWIQQYSPQQSGSSPSVSPDGSRVYITTGQDLSGSPNVYSRLESYNTSDGTLEAYTDQMPGKVIASLVVDYDEDRGGNMIYANVANGSIYGFFETIGTGGGSDSFKCRWKSHEDYLSPGANMGKAGKMLYSAFRIDGDGTLKGYGGGFDTSLAHYDCNGTNGCFETSCTGDTPNWQGSLGVLAVDTCTRSIGYEDGKAQVYFGTVTKLFSFEEAEE